LPFDGPIREYDKNEAFSKPAGKRETWAKCSGKTIMFETTWEIEA
jgi:hypothetical protein